MSKALHHLRLMARNNAYANALLLEACCELEPPEFAAERTGFFPSIGATLNHILEVDRYYLDALEEGGEGPAVYNGPQLETARELLHSQTTVDRRLIAFCDSLSDEDLDRDILHDRGARGVRRETVGNTLLHLFQHQIHHRGQVHAMLAGTKVKPPQLDEFFLEFDRHPRAANQMFGEAGR